MISKRFAWISVVTLAVVGVPAAPVRGEFYQKVIRGLELFGYRFQAEPNLLGNGWDLTASAVYNNREFNLGVASMTLDGTVLARGGFTRRGLPGGHFSLTTGGSPLDYAAAFRTGVQDLTVNGSVLMNIDMEIGLLGFYDQTIQVSNRATIGSSGLMGDSAQPLDYDLGPVKISGNMYLDALAAVAQPWFDLTNTENPFNKFSTRNARTVSMSKTVDELRARIEAGQVLSDEEMATLINDMVLLGMLDGDPSTKPLGSFWTEDQLLNTRGAPEWEAYLEPKASPEPSSLLVLTLGLVPLLGRAGRRRPRA